MPLPYESLTAKILQPAFEVSNEPGSGFLNSVYEAELSAQVLNYLKASTKPLALLRNFGTSKLEYRRFESRFMKNKLNRDGGDEGDLKMQDSEIR